MKINSELFIHKLKALDIQFYTGVPDSLLKDIGAYIADHTTANEHIIAANEGAAVALASGYYLATGKLGLVYLQNSGLGNTINPLLSLADKEVYGIPMLLVIGWRGEPGKKDEPQHVKQGRIQNALLDALEIPYQILDQTNANDFATFLEGLVTLAKQESRAVALIIKADTFEPYKLKRAVQTTFPLNREQALPVMLSQIETSDVIVSTTGKTSREVFEIRKRNSQNGETDFLTVGSMGHACQIALGIALNTDKNVYCLDGDGAILMHMGSLPIIGTSKAKNLHHVVLNNGAHDSVGGQPTVGFDVDFKTIALASGYMEAKTVSTVEEIRQHFAHIKQQQGPTFTEVRIKTGARKDLGRPSSTPMENKQKFMQFLKSWG